MWVQTIQGAVVDRDELHARLDEWAKELAPTAEGWLGATAGVTEDGTFIAMVRFESEETGRRNSDRPEQGEWWGRASALFSGDPVFNESSEVTVDLSGDPDQAGFVQVIQGRTTDPARARELMSSGNSDAWATFRPDILGSVAVGLDGGAYSVLIYFTTEEEAREGERKEPPPELKAEMDAMGELEVGEPTFLDLKDPWLYTPS
jgi:hypothetical protein